MDMSYLLNPCCENCVHFSTNGITVAEIDKKYANSSYAGVAVGDCLLPGHEFDPNFVLSGVDHLRWGTHVACLEYKKF